ncbi:hypothetical protein HZS_1626 [Henneguya salminicola]|nr:hypothetical protein HZS_1626 [Henneguya salminicola]
MKTELEETKNLYNKKAASKCRYSKDVDVLNKINELEEINKELKNELKIMSYENAKKVKTLKNIIDVMSDKLRTKSNEFEVLTDSYEEAITTLKISVSNLLKIVSTMTEQLNSYKIKTESIQNNYDTLYHQYKISEEKLLSIDNKSEAHSKLTVARNSLFK